MHVAYLTHEYPHRHCGGIGTSVRNQARALVRLGHRVSVLGCGPAAEFDDGGVHVRFLGVRSVPRMGWLFERRALGRELNRMVRREGLDVVEAPDWCGPSAGLKLRCPLVVRCHGTATFFERLTREPVRPSVRLAERLGLWQADALSAVTRFAAELTAELFDIRRPIEVISNGVELDQFPVTDPSEAVGNTILHFGTIVRKKGVLDLARIFPEVLEAVPDASLVLIGRDTPDRQSGSPSTWGLLERSLPPEARKRVSYLGPRPYEEIRRHVARATVCVFPSYAETQGLAWIESMACARPVVAYDIGWAPEVIESGVSGFLTPPGDARAMAHTCAGLLREPRRSSEVGAIARRRVESLFCSQVVAGQLVDFYSGVIRGRGRPLTSVHEGRTP